MKALVGLGLPRTHAEVYVYLAKKGPQRVVDLTKALSFSRKKINDSLKNLQDKGIVAVTVEEQSLFSALPFEEALDSLIGKEKEQTQLMQESKEELLATQKTKD